MSKLLVVEDSKMLCDLFNDLLSRHTDFDFDIVTTLAEAKAKVTSQRYEFAVADMNLPDAKEGEIVALLNRYNIAPIVFTGILDDEFREGFESANIVDYVLKERYENILYVVEKLKQLQNNKNTTVMIVDDSTLYSSFLKRNLELHRFKVIVASNGKIALEKLQLHPDTELIITDYHMPEMDGLEFTRSIRKTRTKKDLSIIVLTSDTNSYTTSRFLKEGANDYITKPFSRDEFYARVYQNIETVELYENMKIEFDNNIISLLSKIIELKTSESPKHFKRIVEYSYLLAKLSGIDEDEAKIISEMSALHDIGKAYISNDILFKEASLTFEEFREIKTHTTKGRELLEIAFDSNKMHGQIAMDIVEFHHERYDGKGYPNGLYGDEIPFAARIVAIVDVFDALVNNLVYKEALNIDESVQYIKDNASKQFDPDLVKIFVENINQFKEILDSNTEDDTNNLTTSAFNALTSR